MYRSTEAELFDDAKISDEAKAETKKLLEREHAFQRVLIGGNHLASLLHTLGINPAEHSSAQEVQAKFGPQPTDVWIAWRAIRDLSDHLGSYK